MGHYRLAVRDLVTFIYGTGDLESQSKHNRLKRIGQHLHSERQATYAETDRREVYVEATFHKAMHEITLSGRIDGVLGEKKDIIEEIKTTETALTLIEEDTFPAHMMQAKLYGYMYCLDTGLDSIRIHLTYIHHPSKQHKTLIKNQSFHELKETVDEALDAYMEWLTLYTEHQFEKRKTLEGLTFPHESYREGQYHFMGAVYQALIREDILYATAPTGIGKTIGALFSSLKTLKHENEKIFYLTAKNNGQTIAVSTMEQLKRHGLRIKAITLNSKENMCLMDEVDCDPELCPYAKGYYERVRKALEDIFVHDDVYHAKLIMDYGRYHTICPHEFALDISRYCDVVICDYNYLFDPRVKLVRYTDEGDYAPKLLVDEAHNLVERSRSMHSASLSYAKVHTMLEAFKGMSSIEPSVKRLLKTMEESLEAIGEEPLFIEQYLDPGLLEAIDDAMEKLGQWLDIHKKHKNRKRVREAYFYLLEFRRISEYFTDAFRYTIEQGDGATFNIVCLDASTPLSDIINHVSHGTVLFSATLRPFEYFANLISKGAGSHFEVPSPFDPSRFGVMLDVSTSTKLRDRPGSVMRIVDSIYALLESKKGNYIAFFPSYQYMHMVLEHFDAKGYDLLVQERNLSLFERGDLLERFQSESEHSKILFSVLGGTFSEGIDYIGDMLSGVLIVGVALPALSTINQLQKAYFDAQGFDGFDYTYTYPGMNKVIQAAGRVIRREEDKGVAVLLDTRYATKKYLRLMPSHWRPTMLYKDDYLQTALDAFWSQFES